MFSPSNTKKKKKCKPQKRIPLVVDSRNPNSEKNVKTVLQNFWPCSELHSQCSGAAKKRPQKSWASIRACSRLRKNASKSRLQGSMSFAKVGNAAARTLVHLLEDDIFRTSHLFWVRQCHLTPNVCWLLDGLRQRKLQPKPAAPWRDRLQAGSSAFRPLFPFSFLTKKGSLEATERGWRIKTTE